jgi:hypothetical protein
MNDAAKEQLYSVTGCALILGLLMVCLGVFFAFGGAWGFIITGTLLLGTGLRLLYLIKAKT